MEKRMYREERLRRILELLQLEKKVVVNELADRFERSPSLIRLDLSELETRGLVLRTHGGAILVEGVAEDLVQDKKLLQQRLETFREDKERIGAAAAGRISDGDSILIDGGSTTYYVARALATKHNLTVITTSVQLFPLLLKIPDARVILTGGEVHREYMDLVGDISFDSIQRFSPDRTIIGVDGFSVKYGLTSTEPAIAPLKKAMFARSKDLMIVADSSKFSKVCLTHVGDLGSGQTLITDQKLPEPAALDIRARGVNLVLV